MNEKQNRHNVFSSDYIGYFQSTSHVFFSLESVGGKNLTGKETKKPNTIWAGDLQDTYMYSLQKVNADCKKKLQNLLVLQDSCNFCTENLDRFLHVH